MKPAILAIRPEPGLSATCAAGAELGLPIHPIELAQVERLDWELPDLDHVDGLLIGSANAIRHGGANLDQLKHLPIHAVGEATARQAEEAGFEVAQVGSGGLQNLLDQTDGMHRFLRLAGQERIDLDPPAAISIVERIVYRVTFHELSEANHKILQSKAIVLLYSASSAGHFAAQCDRLKLDRSNITLCALGLRIANAAGGGWQAVFVSDQPADAELLALVRDIWQ